MNNYIDRVLRSVIFWKNLSEERQNLYFLCFLFLKYSIFLNHWFRFEHTDLALELAFLPVFQFLLAVLFLMRKISHDFIRLLVDMYLAKEVMLFFGFNMTSIGSEPYLSLSLK